MHPLLPLIQAGCTAEEIRAFVDGTPVRPGPTKRALRRAVRAVEDGARVSHVASMGAGMGRPYVGRALTDLEIGEIEERWHAGEDLNYLAWRHDITVPYLKRRIQALHRRSKK